MFTPADGPPKSGSLPGMKQDRAEANDSPAVDDVDVKTGRGEAADVIQLRRPSGPANVQKVALPRT